MSPVLTGVGVGPGDPELITLQAVRVLREADRVLVPVADSGEQGRAERTVLSHVDRPVTRLVFGLGDTAHREANWAAAAASVAGAFAAGATSVAFATIGDPNVYSTFGYLAGEVRRRVAGLTVRTVPGITAMQALAARSDTVLVKERESLVLLPLTAGVPRLRAALAAHDTVVAYKGGRALPEVLAALREAGRIDDAVFGAALGLPEETVLPAAQLDPDRPAAYLSTLLVRAPTGGRR